MVTTVEACHKGSADSWLMAERDGGQNQAVGDDRGPPRRFEGTARSARMVGWAMNASHNLEDVPAHRVVNRKGLLSGKHHFDGTNLMQQLLENEGIEVIDNKIVDFENHFWEPTF